MPFPSPSRLEALLRPYAGAKGLPLRVWGVDLGSTPDRPPSLEGELYGAPPRLVALGGNADGLVLVRQTHEGFEDLDGEIVPWPQVARIDRDPHLVRDVLHVEVAGRPPLSIAVSDHVFLPRNRAAAKALCGLARDPSHPVPPEVDPSLAHDDLHRHAS